MVSCNLSVEQDVPDESVFIGSVGDPINEELSGTASYAIFTDPVTGERGVLIQLISQRFRGVSLTGRVKDFPKRGIFEIVVYEDDDMMIDEVDENQIFGLYVHGVDVGYSENFYTKSGVLSITEYTDVHLQGEFNFFAIGFSYVGEEGLPDTTSIEIFIEGEFIATETEIRFD